MKISDLSVHAARVQTFMRQAKQTLPETPTVPSGEVIKLRLRLIWEEFSELVAAYGYEMYLTINSDDREYAAAGHIDHPDDDVRFCAKGGEKPNLVEIADAHGDISVVNVGGMLACGIADRPLLEAIDLSNLAKFDEGHSYRADGKFIKSPSWKKPDIAAAIGLNKETSDGDANSPA